MKLTQEVKTFETNAQFTSEDFTIGDTAVVIEILRNKLYRHKVRTLVQEYMSNGRDAMREINAAGHIQVTLPTVFAPTFKVRDFGPGITPDRMYNVFIKYAASTKRTDNSQTGGFGIGAKSAWSYTESFTIVTAIDGVQRTYVAHIGANNNGRLDFLGEAPTTEPNGTEIQIPVSPRDVSEFRQSAFRAAYFWSNEEYPDFINLGNEKPEQYKPSERIGLLEVNNDIPNHIVSSWDAGIVIAIDGIPYVAGPSLIDKIEPLSKLAKLVNGRLVLHFKTGEIEVSASREEIADSKMSIEKLTKIATTVLKEVNAKIVSEFKVATTPFEHLQIFMRLVKSYKLDAYRKFGDFEVTDKNTVESDLLEHVKVERCQLASDNSILKGTLGQANKRRSYSWNRIKITPDLIENLFYTDGSESAVTTNHRLRAILKDQDRASCLVFSKKDTDAGQFDKVIKGLGAQNLLEVNFTKPDRKAREKKAKEDRTKAMFCIHRMDRYSNCAQYTSLETNSEKWLYTELGKMTKGELKKLNDYTETKGYKICTVSKGSLSRLKGDKNFKCLEAWLENFEHDAKDISQMKFEVAQHQTMMQRLAKAQGIKDKFLLKMIEAYKSEMKFVGGNIPEIIKKKIGKVEEVEAFKADDKALGKELSSRWSLLSEMYWRDSKSMLEEVVAYINAK